MSWNFDDSVAVTGTVEVDAEGLVTGTGTAFTTELKKRWFFSTADGESSIKAINSDTELVLKEGFVTAAGSSYGASRKPLYIEDDPSIDSEEVFGVDVTELALADGVAHAGWVRRTEGTGGRAGRVFTEVLIASRRITGDAGDDAQFPDE